MGNLHPFSPSFVNPGEMRKSGPLSIVYSSKHD